MVQAMGPGGFGPGGYGGNNGGYGNPGGGGGGPPWPYIPAHLAQANDAKEKYLKAYRMTFVMTRADADPISFLYNTVGSLINEIQAVALVQVKVSDIHCAR